MALSVPAKAFLRQLARIDERDREAVYRAYREAFKLEGQAVSNVAIGSRVAQVRGSFEAFEFLEAEKCRAEHSQAAAAARQDEALFDRDKALAEMEQAAIEGVTGDLRAHDTSPTARSKLGDTAVRILARTKQGTFDVVALRQRTQLFRQLQGQKKQRDEAREADPSLIVPGDSIGTA